MHDENCIFCKLATHEIPTEVVYEDDQVLAFNDMEPLMPTHVLVIPKDHYATIADNVPEELLGHIFTVVNKIAGERGLTERGFRLMVNAGDDASQSVKHFHVHLLGGHKMPRPNDQNWSAEANED